MIDNHRKATHQRDSEDIDWKQTSSSNTEQDEGYCGHTVHCPLNDPDPADLQPASSIPNLCVTSHNWSQYREKWQPGAVAVMDWIGI